LPYPDRDRLVVIVEPTRDGTAAYLPLTQSTTTCCRDPYELTALFTRSTRFNLRRSFAQRRAFQDIDSCPHNQDASAIGDAHGRRGSSLAL
jgi:hypothetical protein